MSKDLVKAQDEMSFSSDNAELATLLKGFEDAELNNLQPLTGNYLNLKPETVYNLVFKGMSTMKGEQGKEVEIVELINKEGQSVVNGNTVLVNSLKKVTQLPCFVRIVTKKEVKSSNGTYLAMDVLVLPGTVGK